MFNYEACPQQARYERAELLAHRAGIVNKSIWVDGITSELLAQAQRSRTIKLTTEQAPASAA